MEGRALAQFRVLIYADGLALPLVIPLDCRARSLAVELPLMFSGSLVATHAEVWDGSRMLMHIDAAGVAAMVGLSRMQQRSQTSSNFH